MAELEEVPRVYPSHVDDDGVPPRFVLRVPIPSAVNPFVRRGESQEVRPPPLLWQSTTRRCGIEDLIDSVVERAHIHGFARVDLLAGGKVGKNSVNFDQGHGENSGWANAPRCCAPGRSVAGAPRSGLTNCCNCLSYHTRCCASMQPSARRAAFRTPSVAPRRTCESERGAPQQSRPQLWRRGRILGPKTQAALREFQKWTLGCDRPNGALDQGICDKLEEERGSWTLIDPLER